MPLTIKSAVINYKDPDTGDYVEVNAVGDTSHVTDVQVNGTSVVTDNVANVPMATSNILGVVKPSNSGIQVNSSGQIFTKKASSALIKSGENSYDVICPYNQHESTFYALAKLAGADMKNSSNAVGEFTDEAKVAIQKMLVIRPRYGNRELIVRYTVSQNTDEVLINRDVFEMPFKLAYAEIIVKFGTPTTNTRDYIKGYILDDSGLSRTLPTMTLISAGATGCWFNYIFQSINGLPYMIAKSSNTGNTQNAQLVTYSASVNGETVIPEINALCGICLQQYNSSQTLIPQGTEIIIYGCRLIED